MEQAKLIDKLEKGRAEFAYKCVLEAKEKLGADSKKYKSYAKKIPSMILSNGLGQTLAFIKSKREKAYEFLYSQLTGYMKSENTVRIPMPKEEEDLTRWVISCNSSKYRYISQEILAFLGWLKRFAEGMIEEERNDGDNKS
jgi:CRISPR-associated protein Cmr5